MTLSFARGCCKAYHPECVGQDSTILETNERWICGKPFITSPSAILTSNFFFSNLVGSICTFRIRQILYGALLRKRGKKERKEKGLLHLHVLALHSYQKCVALDYLAQLIVTCIWIIIFSPLIVPANCVFLSVQSLSQKFEPIGGCLQC